MDYGYKNNLKAILSLRICKGLSYGLILWGNSANVEEIFILHIGIINYDDIDDGD